MPYLTAERLSVTAPVSFSETFDKPTGDKIVIKAIHLTSNKNPFFVKVWAMLYEIKDSERQMGVLHTVAPSLEFAGWDLNRMWPHGWKLTIGFRTQVDDDKTRLTVEYDIIEKEPKKKGFGEA